MSAKNDTIILNNGAALDIATFTVGSPVAGATCLAQGTNHPPSCLNMAGDFILMTKPVVPIYYYNNMTNAKSREDFYDVSNQNDITWFNNNVRWIWGSVEKGGCYIRKTSTTKCVIGGVTCLCHNTNDDTFYFRMNETSELSTNDISDLVFLYEEGHLNDTFPVMDVSTLADMRYLPQPESGIATYYVQRVFNALTNLYTSHDMPSMYEPTRYITWEGILGDKPSCYWKANEGYSGVFPHSLEMRILGGDIPANVETTGDIWGGQQKDPEYYDPNENAGTSEPGGGDGEYPSSTGHNDHPDSESMTVDVINSGFVTLYNPTLAQVKQFNNFLFTDIGDVEALSLKRLIANPIDYVLFLAMCHFTPNNNGVTDTIKYAGINTNVSATKVSSAFKVLDCGYIDNIHDCNNFQDYSPYTKYSAYLPYIGIVDLSADDITGSYITLEYNVDLLSGDCVATLKCKRLTRRNRGDAELDDVCYRYNGNCYRTIPLTGTDWRNMIGSTFSILGGAAAVATGNIAGIVGGAGAIAEGVTSQKSSVSRSGQISGAAGYLDAQKPYIIIQRPLDDNPENYKGFKGYVANIRLELGQLSGYTEIVPESLWVNDFNGITEEEAEMLKNITSTGFYL